jgi:hypothetical protein
MGFSQAVASGGHAGFYSTLGLSLAVFLLPWYNHFAPLIQTGLGIAVDTFVLAAGVGGALAAILYGLSPDALIDRYIAFTGKYHSGLELFKRRSSRKLADKPLIQIARIDYLVSGWRRVTWKSVHDSWMSTIERSSEDGSIRKVLWTAKNRSVVGLSLMLWAFSLQFLGIALWFLFVIGLVLMLAAWLREDILNIKKRLRELAVLRYAQDTFAWWIPSERERTYVWLNDVIEKFKNATKEVDTIVVSNQWKRLVWLNTWLASELEEFCKHPLHVHDRLYEQWTHHLFEIARRRSKGLDSSDYASRFLSILNVFKLDNHLDSAEWASHLNLSQVGSLTHWLSVPYDWGKLLQNYRGFRQELTDAFWGLPSDSERASWINTLTASIKAKEEDALTLEFRFACQYSGTELDDEVYILILNTAGDGLPTGETTMTLIEKVKCIFVDEKKPRTFLWKVARHKNVDTSVRTHIIKWSDSLSKELGRQLATESWPSNLRPDEKQEIAKLRNRLRRR